MLLIIDSNMVIYMETVEINKLDESDKEFVNILSRFGYTVNEGKVLVSIAHDTGITTKGIMQCADMNQSAVSVSVNRLIEKGIVRAEKGFEERGRPAFHYSLVKSLDDVVSDIEIATKTQIEQTKEALEKLKEIA